MPAADWSGDIYTRAAAWLAGVLVTLAVGAVPVSAAETLAGLPASFEGELPCADCEGIRYHLDLHPDTVFFLRMTYLGRGDGASTDDIGAWDAGDEGTKLVLWGGREDREMFRIVDGGTLRKLDLEGREIESSLNYDLKRMAGFEPIEPRLVMRGRYRYMADAALFEECLTGRQFPVAMEADNIALERAYLDVRGEPGEPILVELEGQIAERPTMEGDATVLSVVPERFLGIWPGETCGARMVVSELEGTYWKLIRVGDAPVVVRDQREPHMVLSSIDGRFAGFTGCNGMTGSYQVTGESISFGQIAATMKACLDGMEYEPAFKQALENARSWKITGQHLELRDDNGVMLARFEARVKP